MSESKKLELSPSIAIIIAGVVIAGAIVLTSGRPTGQVGAAPVTAPSAVNLRTPSASEHIIGSPTAPIVLVEYSDFQCPYCNVIYPTLKKIVSESNGQIAWVYREMPLTSIHPEAEPAAEAAECIADQLGNDGFWKFADDIFANQSKMNAAYYPELAKQLGADPTKFASCISSGKYKQAIQTDSLEGQSNGANGTPFTVVLNTKTGKGAPVSGALPYAQIMAVIKSVQ